MTTPVFPDPDILQSPVGPYRDKFSVTIGTDDYDPGFLFCVQAGTAGDLTYRTAMGSADPTETLTAGDSVVGAGGVPVLIRAVRGTSTVTSIIVSRL